jgi:hypothetical protein
MKRVKKDLRKNISEQQYWEEVLARENLSMTRGLSIGRENIVYAGNATNLENSRNLQREN